MKDILKKLKIMKNINSCQEISGQQDFLIIYPIDHLQQVLHIPQIFYQHLRVILRVVQTKKL